MVIKKSVFNKHILLIYSDLSVLKFVLLFFITYLCDTNQALNFNTLIL